MKYEKENSAVNYWSIWNWLENPNKITEGTINQKKT